MESYVEQGKVFLPKYIGDNEIYLWRDINYERETKTLIFIYQLLNLNMDIIEEDNINISKIIEENKVNMLNNWEDDNQDIIILKNMNLIIEYIHYDINNMELFRQKMLYNTPLEFIN